MILPFCCAVGMFTMRSEGPTLSENQNRGKENCRRKTLLAVRLTLAEIEHGITDSRELEAKLANRVVLMEWKSEDLRHAHIVLHEQNEKPDL